MSNRLPVGGWGALAKKPIAEVRPIPMDTEQETQQAGGKATDPAETPAPPADSAPPETPSPSSSDAEAAQADSSPGIDVEEIEDFGQTLAEWEGEKKSVKEGDVVIGTVLKVLEKEVIVDIGYKSEGVIDIHEFRGVGGTPPVAGDKVDVLLEKTEDGDGTLIRKPQL